MVFCGSVVLWFNVPGHTGPKDLNVLTKHRTFKSLISLQKTLMFYMFYTIPIESVWKFGTAKVTSPHGGQFTTRSSNTLYRIYRTLEH